MLQGLKKKRERDAIKRITDGTYMKIACDMKQQMGGM